MMKNGTIRDLKIDLVFSLYVTFQHLLISQEDRNPVSLILCFVTNREKFLCSPLPKPMYKIEPSAISFLGESMSEVM